MINNNEVISRGIPDDKQRCSRCGKHVNELKPYGSKDGIYEGQILIKTYRKLELVEHNDECEMILKLIAKFGDAPELHELYGTSKIESAISYDAMRNCYEESWECRSCIKEEGAFKHYSDNTD